MRYVITTYPNGTVERAEFNSELEWEDYVFSLPKGSKARYIRAIGKQEIESAWELA